MRTLKQTAIICHGTPFTRAKIDYFVGLGTGKKMAWGPKIKMTRPDYTWKFTCAMPIKNGT